MPPSKIFQELTSLCTVEQSLFNYIYTCQNQWWRFVLFLALLPILLPPGPIKNKNRTNLILNSVENQTGAQHYVWRMQ